jgi:hypothetical protein
VRKSDPRRTRTKNGVIRDARLGASPISIHWRRVKLERFSDYKTHLRRALMVRVTNLIPDLSPYGTNTRHAQGRASPITQKSETCFILTCH